MLMAAAFLDASSAMAGNTQLCMSDENPCATGNVISHVHEETVSGSPAKLLSSIGNVTCNALFLGLTLGLGAPLVIHGNFTYTGCLRNGSSCTVNEVSTSTLINVLRTEAEKATVTGEGEVNVHCGLFINCTYDDEGVEGTFKGALSAPTNGESSTSEATMHHVGGGICPETGKLDIRMTPLLATYLGDGGGGGGLSSTSTSLTTSLKGGGKEGAEITVAEGSKVKDTATLSGENSSKAGGTLDYAVYKDKECKELVAEAGKVTVKEGKVPDSEEKELEAGREYFWQAKYLGDEMNKESTSTCNKEVETVKAKTTLATKLSGGGKEGEEITVAEGSKVKDTATLSGTKSSTATGTIKYAVYKDKECKELASKAGEGEVKGTKAAGSEEKELEAAAVYYWQAEYLGDSLHEESTSTCGKEAETIKAATSLSTLLGAENPGSEKPIEGEEISLAEGTPVADSASLGGTAASTATGSISFAVYTDGECSELVAEVGKADVEEGAAFSKEIELEEGAYYWQARYEGDSLHETSTSPCTEVVNVIARTSLTTTLSGQGEEGGAIEVSEGASVTDQATLTGTKAEKATGYVEYFVYEDEECKDLVAEAGKVKVEGSSVPASSAVELKKAGVYYWQAVYSGDALNDGSTSACRSELEIVLSPITTTLSDGQGSGASIKVLEGTSVYDEATLHGGEVTEATGYVEYFVYEDEECKDLVAEAGKVKVEGSSVPASSAVELKTPGVYYWQAVYSGDEQNPAATSACGSEITVVRVPTSLTTSLSGGGTEGGEISVKEGTAVSDQAMLSGAEAVSAAGAVRYTVYKDASCTEVAMPAGVADVKEGTVGASSAVTLSSGTYYWQAEYWGDGVNGESTSKCGSEIEVIAPPPILTTLSGGGQSGTEIQVTEETPITDKAKLHGKYAGEATGYVEYFVYEDEECKDLVAEAGKVKVEGSSVPASSAVELKTPGVYYWQAEYSGDGKNLPATTTCGSTEAQVIDPGAWQYAALGDSFSAGEGVERTGGTYYSRTDAWASINHGPNSCHRSPNAWPAIVAASAFGEEAVTPPTIYERSPRFIFRACSGAETINIWHAGGSMIGGQWDESKEPGDLWFIHPSQLLWLTLPGGLFPNPNLAVVSLTIGGNDAGFAPIVEACHTLSRGTYWWFGEYDPVPCQETIKKWEEAGFAAIEARLPIVLKAIAERAPDALIRIFLYPRVLNMSFAEISIGQKGNLVVNNLKFGNEGLTAAESLERYISRLNAKIVSTVAGAGVGKARVIADTEAAFSGPFGNHRYGDPAPWLNGIVFSIHYKESFHPSVCGHQALAVIAQPYLVSGATPIIPCP
jgi:hypothetical protein